MVSAYIPNPDEKIVTYALGIARDKVGKMRTLFADLNRADEVAKFYDRCMTLQDLQDAVRYRQEAGVWPEDK